jgi:uncharacterized metal-binding protein YceD (DUF177 family)
MKQNDNSWSVPVAVDDLPDTGLHRAIEAPAEVRAELAELAGLRELPQLSAEFDILRLGTGVGAGVVVTGRVKAKVGQICVVSLEPMESEIEETVDLEFAPAAGAPVAKKARKRANGSDEPPEPLVDGRLDLGALATEFLILGIDPYPRKPGSQFAAPVVEDPGEHPFAALEALKKRPERGQP